MGIWQLWAPSVSCRPRKPSVPAASLRSTSGHAPGLQGGGCSEMDATHWSLLPKQRVLWELSCKPCKEELQQSSLCCECMYFCWETPMGSSGGIMGQEYLWTSWGLLGFPGKGGAKRAVEACCLHPPPPYPCQEAAGKERGDFHPASVCQALHLCYNLGWGQRIRASPGRFLFPV